MRGVRLASGALVVGLLVQPAAASVASSVRRIAGVDRYDTAARIAGEFPAPSTRVFVAVGTDFRSSLVAGAAAALAGSPLLLVGPTTVPISVTAELTRLAPAEIVVVSSA